MWYNLKKKESAIELNNAERPGRPLMRTNVDDGRILSTVKKNSSQLLGQEHSGGGRHIIVNVAFMNVNTEDCNQVQTTHE